MKKICLFFLALLSPLFIWASEADLKIPELSSGQHDLLLWLSLICLAGILFSLFQYSKVKAAPVHEKMSQVSATIFQTCKTYLIQQGKFLLALLLFIAVCVSFYFGYLEGSSVIDVILILSWVVIGIAGSYGVAWFGIRMNTLANSRMAFIALRGRPRQVMSIPLRSGMSIGVMLICVELILMLFILLFIPRHLAGACFLGFAIGESLGASALRIAGGIFTKIADIGSDLMKIVFKIKEDDPRNPGVIADCTGDNAGDSVGPTADGFETYGVTGVALISFIVLAVGLPSLGFSATEQTALQNSLLVWIFVMRILMIVTSLLAYWLNNLLTSRFYLREFNPDFEKPLTSLVWVTSFLSIIVTFLASYLLIGPGTELSAQSADLWLILSAIISCGTLGAALIPEFTKKFTSPKSAHVQETVAASREGGASLTVLSGLVAGFFSSFWQGLVFLLLMFIAFILAVIGLGQFMIYPVVCGFGLVAFGFLGMGPVTIAVDSYGPVTDNAQSVYELSLIEEDIDFSTKDIRENFGFDPNFEQAKYLLESNDGAGNTFKATAKPVLIGTAVVGATTMIFSIILVIKNVLGVEPESILHILNPWTIFGFLMGGMVIFWFSGASIQAVSVGAYKAVAYIKKHINLDPEADLKASTENSKEVVKICTQYAQKGMWNIFLALFSFTLAIPFISAFSVEAAAFFVSYLISVAVFGLIQSVFMANSGGCWDNSKKVVEVDLKEKGSQLHDATIIGDTVGDPFKDTSSVAMNPIIKFTTLFGLLAMEIAISAAFRSTAPYIGLAFFLLALYFVYRSFYKMRIPRT
ncbi:MAG: sodium-translocating pyrophosphatase [Patescibacteria group bacterium]